MDGFIGEGGVGVAGFPTIHVVSDSIGETARSMAQASAAQFGVTNPKVEVLGKVKSFEQVRDHLSEHARLHVERLGEKKLLVFYTLVHGEIRDKVSAWIQEQPNICGVDLLTSAIDAIAQVSGLTPDSTPGALRVTDINYFHRVEALEFTIEHDDGRNPQDLTKADMVLLGVSRASKTPLSIYLAQHGYHIANVPLDPDTEPPHQIFDVDRTRLFGLMTSPEVLADIRTRRLGNARAAAGAYADLEYIYSDLERARELMRRLGCIVVRTDRRAVEETAQEILSHYLRNHPSPADMII